MMIYVFHSLSHTCFFFSLYTNVSCLFNLSLFSTWYMDVFFLVPFRKDKLKPSQDSEPSSATTSKVQIFWTRLIYFVILSRMYSRTFNVLLWFCHGFPNVEIVRDTYFYVIGISFDKTHFTCIWVNLSRFKMIITSDYIKDMKITQELLKKSAICRFRYLLDRTSIR